MFSIPLLMVVAYLVITMAISFYFVKRNESSKAFSVASGGLGLPTVVALLFSEMIAGSGTIGNAASGFTTGFSSVWANWGMCLGCIFFVIFVARFYKAMGIRYGDMSVPEAYEKMFDFRCRMVLLVVIVLVYGILYSTQATAAAAILAPLMGVDSTVMTIIVAALFVLVTVVGGMKGIAAMNLLHSFVMYLGIFTIAFLALRLVGGPEVLVETLPSSYFSFGQPDWLTTIASAIGTAFSYLAAATTVSAVFTAKSMRTASIGCLIAGLLIVPFALGPSLIGMCGKVLMPDAASAEIIYTVAAQLGPVFSVIISMAILAAIWSAGPSLLLIVSTTVTRDFYRGVINKNATDRQQLNCTRIVALIIGIVASLLGMQASSILNSMLGAFQIRSVVGIVLMAALFWKRVNARSAFWSMLFGGIVAAVWFFGGSPVGISAFWPAAAVTLIVLIPVTLTNKEPISQSHLRYAEALEYTKEHEKETAK